MPTYRLTIEFEGTRYSGWQEQRNARTVAGEIRTAVERAGGRVLQLGGAGRTDAGVHALGQTAHLRLERRVDPESFRRIVNDRLPRDIHILALAPAPDAFDARRDARSRAYLYQIARRRTGLAGRWVWWVKSPLEPALMEEAARSLVGRRDFAAFTERPAVEKSTLVDISGAEVVVEGGLVLVRLTASHFLWKMVRRLVGALVRVGLGEWSRDQFDELVAGTAPGPRSGTVAEATAPACGLFLERVLYAGDSPLGPPRAATPVAAEPGPAGDRRSSARPGGPPDQTVLAREGVAEPATGRAVRRDDKAARPKAASNRARRRPRGV